MELSQLKLAFVAGCLGQGGAERQLFYIVRALVAAGAAVRVLSLTRGEFWEQPICELGVSVTWVGKRQSPATRAWQIVNELRHDRPHVVQSQHFFCNLYAAIAGRALGLPEIGAIRSNVHSEVAANGRLKGSLLLALPRVLAANSRSAVDVAIQRGVAPDRLFLLPNAVDCEQFKPITTTPDGHVRVLAVGRLAKLKRFDLFLDAFGACRNSHHLPVRARVVGDGPEHNALMTLAAAKGFMPGVVDFVGASANTAEHFAWADLLVLSSDWEGTPNVILEAMASGLPVVATAVGGVTEIVEDEVTGLLVPPGDGRRLGEALRRLCESPDMRRSFGAYARARAVERHSCGKLAARLTELYGKVIA